MSFRVNTVEFSDLEQVLRIFKAQGLDRNDVLGLFSDERNRRVVLERFDRLQPYTVPEAIALRNAEQRMAALAAFAPEEIVSQMKAKRLDQQTVRKRSLRWDENLNPTPVEYADTYELLKLRVKGEHRWQNLDVYVVRCTCPSTDRTFYLYVPEEVARQKDAIAAVAWTMQIDGRPLTRDEYCELLYSET